MKQEVKIGQTDYTVLILVRDSTTGAPKLDLTNASAGIDVCYVRVKTDNDVTVTAGAPVALATPALTDVHLDWGFLQVDKTNAPGLYRLDIADGVFATGAWSAVVSLICTGCDPVHIEFILVPEAPYTGVNVSITGAVATDVGNSATVFKTTLTSATDNFYNDTLCLITSGALIGQIKKVTDYDGTNKIITVGTGFTATPADGVTFSLINK